jgi:hypothetical protein
VNQVQHRRFARIVSADEEIEILEWTEFCFLGADAAKESHCKSLQKDGHLVFSCNETTRVGCGTDRSTTA